VGKNFSEGQNAGRYKMAGETLEATEQTTNFDTTQMIAFTPSPSGEETQK
jgi:hypothetical protein